MIKNIWKLMTVIALSFSLLVSCAPPRHGHGAPPPPPGLPKH